MAVRRRKNGRRQVFVSSSSRPGRPRRFYTALYRALAAPTTAHDVDGRYRGLDGKVHAIAAGRYYTDLSLWDTHRTQLPLLNFLAPDVAVDVARRRADSLGSRGLVDSVDAAASPRHPSAKFV